MARNPEENGKPGDGLAPARWAGLPYAGTDPLLGRRPERPAPRGARLFPASDLAATLADQFLESVDREGLLPVDDHDAECTASYLILLLNELSRPEGIARFEHYWSDTSFELAERVTRAQSRRDLFAIYRTNADYILLSLGLFDRTPVGRAGRGQGVHRKRRDIECRGTHYYEMASAQAEVLYGREGELTRIMETLARHFPGYCHALRMFGSHGLKLVKRWSRGEEYHLLRDVEAMVRIARVQRCREHLLEVYAAWKRRANAHTRARVVQAARRVEEVDPTFSSSWFEERWLGRSSPGKTSQDTSE